MTNDKIHSKNTNSLSLILVQYSKMEEYYHDQKNECIHIFPSDRKYHPDWYSRSELKKMKLMPKPNVKPAVLVIRKYYDDYFLYDISKTKPFQLTKKQKADINKRAKANRLKRIETARIEKKKCTCNVCKKLMTTDDRIYNIYDEDYYDYTCKICYQKIYESHKEEYI